MSGKTKKALGVAKTHWKKICVITVSCLAVVALSVGVTLAVTREGSTVPSRRAVSQVENGGPGSSTQDPGSRGPGEPGNKEDGKSTGPGQEGQRPGPGPGQETMHELGIDIMSEVTSALSLTEQELESELEGGKTISQLAEEKGISGDQLAETVTASMSQALSQAVSEGNVPANEAEEIQSHLAEHVSRFIEDGPRSRREGPPPEGAPGENQEKGPIDEKSGQKSS